MNTEKHLKGARAEWKTLWKFFKSSNDRKIQVQNQCKRAERQAVMRNENFKVCNGQPISKEGLNTNVR